MAWHPSLNPLRDALVSLYPDGALARRVAHAARLCTDHIPIYDHAAVVWQAILEEASKQRRIRALIRVATGDHPDDEALHIAAGAFCRWVARGRPTG